MTISTLEGVVENGQIRLLEGITLPEKAKVFVIVPELEPRPKARIYSPRLAHTEQAGDFVKQIIEVIGDV
ncbi:MAG: hypothetical protein WD669_09645 [Pirellulales bacterium]